METKILNVDQLMKKLKNDRNSQKIYNHYENGGKCDGWRCNPAAIEEFSKKLSEEGIPHTCVQGEKESIIISRAEDRRLIQGIRKDFLEQSRFISELSLDQLKAQNIGDEIHSIRGVSEQYAAVFTNEAKTRGINFARSDNGDGTYDLYYSRRDSAKAHTAIMNTVVATRGTIGKFEGERAVQELAREKDIYRAISNQEECYIVSQYQPNKYMHITKSGYELSLDDKTDRKNRDANNFQVATYNKIYGTFVKPVVLTEEEFERIRHLSKEEYSRHISQKRTVAIEPNTAELHRMELERMAKQIAEYKMSFENNELNTNFYEKFITATEFERNEFITDVRLDREEEMSLSNPKSMSPEIQSTIDKHDSLPLEDREYVDERVNEYIKEVRETKEKVDIIKVTERDYSENIDLMIAAYYAERNYFGETRENNKIEIERD